MVANKKLGKGLSSLLGNNNNMSPPAIGVQINSESNGKLEIIKYY